MIRCNAKIPLDPLTRTNAYCTLARGHAGLHGSQLVITSGWYNLDAGKLVHEPRGPSKEQTGEPESDPFAFARCEHGFVSACTNLECIKKREQKVNEKI